MTCFSYQLYMYMFRNSSTFECYTVSGYRASTITGFIRGILRGVRYAKSLRVLFLHRRSPSWTTLVLYSRVVFIFNEPTKGYYIMYSTVFR